MVVPNRTYPRSRRTLSWLPLLFTVMAFALSLHGVLLVTSLSEATLFIVLWSLAA